MSDPTYRKTVNAWCLYDWANSAFAATVMAALFPPFYRSLAKAGGLAPHQATAAWGYTTAFALLLIALAAPILGAVADHTGSKKRFTAFFAGLGVLATLCLVIPGPGAWRLATAVFLLGNLGFAGANIFYDALLPHLAREGDMDRISTRGFAMGYLGGGILLVVNAAWVMKPGWFSMPDTAFAVKASFVSVAAWWGLFSVPLFRRVPEPPAGRNGSAGRGVLRASLARLAQTCRDLVRYRQLALFLVAFWIYNDGIGTIIKMATAYGDEIGIGVGHMTAALVLTQFVGFPCTLFFGRLAGGVGAKKALLGGLGVYALISLGGYFMRTPAHFYVLALAVGTVQGGTQALSRSLFGSMVPKHKSAEFFGFFSTTAKFAGIAGPLLFALVSQWTGNSRLSIVALIVFFVLGAAVLCCVDVDEGRNAAGDGRAGHDPSGRQRAELEIRIRHAHGGGL